MFRDVITDPGNNHTHVCVVLPYIHHIYTHVCVLLHHTCTHVCVVTLYIHPCVCCHTIHTPMCVLSHDTYTHVVCCHTIHKKLLLQKRIMGQNEKTMFAHELNNIHWEDLFCLDSCQDMWDLFHFPNAIAV